MSNLQHSPLFEAGSLGEIAIKNRIIMAPLTRTRCDAGHMPNALMAEYYAQRASAGLIIAEATMVTPQTSAFIHEPGINNHSQQLAWQDVTEAVHAQNGKIVLQLWHGGRACHPALNQGLTPVSASAKAIENALAITPEGKQPFSKPRAMQQEDIDAVVEDFRAASQRAKAAGFDGIELHAANGYLIDQFLRDSCNQRDDAFGGSLANRCRLLRLILDAVIDIWGPGRVGIRLSPINQYNDMRDSDAEALIIYLADMLNQYPLAYLHIMRGDSMGAALMDVLSPARQHYHGAIISNMAYQAAEAAQHIQSKKADAIAFGTLFIANPDLVKRLQYGASLNDVDYSKLYSKGAAGYTDYPTLTTQQAAKT